MMKHLTTLAPVAAVAVLIAFATPAQAGGSALSGEDLTRWGDAYVELAGMSPKWGVQGVEAFKASTDAGVPIFYLDVRTPAEWEGGVVDGATTVSLIDLPSAEGLAQLPEDKGAIIGVYCKSGHRSTLALTLLHHLGYGNAISMAGGFQAWSGAGYPVVDWTPVTQ